MWKVTAGRGNIFASEFIERGYVAIGWSEAGDYTKAASREELTALFCRTWPEHTDKQNAVGAAQVWRFLTVFRAGDRVLTYDSGQRLYHVGTIVGDPVYDASQNERLPVQRVVRWEGKVSRDALSQGTRNTLGAIMTVFLLSEVATAEIEAHCLGRPISNVSEQVLPLRPHVDEVVETDPFADIEGLALERIKDHILGLSWDEMQDLVAAFLRALGYRTIVAGKGSDGGRDIIASRDGFGFERPRIVVEVKHRKGQMGAGEIRNFLHTLHPEDRGLYVSTGGFSKEAQYEAKNARTVTHLMNSDGLATAIIEQYEAFDQAGKDLLPLRRVYWPK